MTEKLTATISLVETVNDLWLKECQHAGGPRHGCRFCVDYVIKKAEDAVRERIIQWHKEMEISYRKKADEQGSENFEQGVIYNRMANVHMTSAAAIENQGLAQAIREGRT